MVYNEVIEFQSNYKEPYFWWFGNPASGDSTGSNQIKKELGRVSPRLGRRENGQCDLMCGAPLDDLANAGLCCIIHVWWVWF